MDEPEQFTQPEQHIKLFTNDPFEIIYREELIISRHINGFTVFFMLVEGLRLYYAVRFQHNMEGFSYWFIYFLFIIHFFPHTQNSKSAVFPVR